MRRSSFRRLGIVLAVVGILALAIGLAYLLVPSSSLPSFLSRSKAAGHHSKRAAAGLVLGVLLLAGAAYSLVRGRRSHRRHHSQSLS